MLISAFLDPWVLSMTPSINSSSFLSQRKSIFLPSIFELKSWNLVWLDWFRLSCFSMHLFLFFKRDISPLVEARFSCPLQDETKFLKTDSDVNDFYQGKRKSVSKGIHIWVLPFWWMYFSPFAKIAYFQYVSALWILFWTNCNTLCPHFVINYIKILTCVHFVFYGKQIMPFEKNSSFNNVHINMHL